jgi:hypothetical protein
MEKNDSPRQWKISKKGTIQEDLLVLPLKWRRSRSGNQRVVEVMFDPFDGSLDYPTIDLLMAVMASSGNLLFRITTEHFKFFHAYNLDLKTRAIPAAMAYEQRKRDHLDKYKYDFHEGYTIPDPPTPEVRAIYDSAAVRQNRPTNPCGTTLHSGFAGGECHWRPWPLNNVWIKCTDMPDAEIFLPSVPKFKYLQIAQQDALLQFVQQLASQDPDASSAPKDVIAVAQKLLKQHNLPVASDQKEETA